VTTTSGRSTTEATVVTSGAPTLVAVSLGAVSSLEQEGPNAASTKMANTPTVRERRSEVMVRREVME
jgi:hypothetical protein